MASDAKSKLRLGFLTAVEIREHNYVGGLLVTDRFGRPLEFQCTTPVKPNRTQELLYGPTLVPFIIGELLGKALLDRIKIAPSLLFTDRDEMLLLRPLIDIPILSSAKESLEPKRDGLAEGSDVAIPTVRVGRQKFAMNPDFASDEQLISKITSELSSEADISEPLERVSEALKETMATVIGKPRAA
jgi:hypothetical protein